MSNIFLKVNKMNNNQQEDVQQLGEGEVKLKITKRKTSSNYEEDQ